MPRSLTVELDDEEYADLEEYCRHHPKEVADPQDALKKMAGLKLYRKLKKTLDPERKKAPVEGTIALEPEMVLGADLGIPSVYPCALDEILKANGKTYDDFVRESIEEGTRLLAAVLERGEFERTPDGVVLRDTPELRKLADDMPGVSFVAKVERKSDEGPV